MHWFDTSSYLQGHFLHSELNKKKFGENIMMKQTENLKINSLDFGQSCVHSRFIMKKNETKKAKGISKSAKTQQLCFFLYAEALWKNFETVLSMDLIRSRLHQLYVEAVYKKCLSAFDDKILLEDAVSSYAYGHYKTKA